MKTRMCAIVFVLLFLSGCSLFGPEEQVLELTTNQQTYSLDKETIIEVIVENVSNEVIYFSSCMPTRLEEVDGKRVVGTLGFPVCQCICSRTLQPGEQWVERVFTQQIEQFGAHLPLDPTHRYRMRLALYRDKDHQQLLNESSLLSNLFRLTQ